MKVSIFYSWQADLPSRTNRGLIQEALELAVADLAKDDELSVEAVIDRDTEGLAGSPNIATAIFSKIDSCQIFVADISIVNSVGVATGARPTPNPNVLFELGYATKTLGTSFVIQIQNSHFGGPESLPFDMKMNRTLRYTNDPEVPERAAAKTELRAQLLEALKFCIRDLHAAAKPAEDAVASLKATILDPSKLAVVHDRVVSIGDAIRATAAALPEEFFTSEYSAELLRQRVSEFEDATRVYEPQLGVIGRWAETNLHSTLTDSLRRAAELPDPAREKYPWYTLRFYPLLRMVYALGISASHAQNYALLKIVLYDLKMKVGFTQDRIIAFANSVQVCDNKYAQDLPDLNRHKTALSKYLRDSFEKPMSGIIPTTAAYLTAFDNFEAYVSLAHADWDTDKDGEPKWGPPGFYIFNPGKLLKEILETAEREGPNWKPFRAGLFQGSIDRLRAIVTRLEQHFDYIRYKSA